MALSPRSHGPRSLLPGMAVCLAAGMAASLLAPASPAAAGWAAGLLLAGWAASLGFPAPRISLFLAALATSSAGWLLTAVSLAPSPLPEGVSGLPCRVAGTVAGQPREFEGGVAVTLRGVTLDGGDGARPLDEPVRLGVYGAGEGSLLPGDAVRAETVLRVPEGRRSPGGRDRRLSLAGEGIRLAGAVEAGPRFLANRGSVPPHLVPVTRFVGRTSALLAGLGQPADGLLHAILLGRTHRLEPSVKEAFRSSGLAHVLSVSGLHVGLFGLAAYWVLSFVLRRVPPLAERFDVRRPAALLSVFPMVFYTAVAGARAPALRSVVMAGAAAVAVVAGRSSLAVNTLSAAAVLLLAASPPALASPSFQLSFAATLGIVLAVGRYPWLFRRGEGGPVGRVMRAAVGSLMVSAAAFLATAPLAARHFSTVSPAGMVATLAVLPLLSGVVLPCGLAAGTLVTLGLPASWPAAAAAWGAGLMKEVAAWFAGLGWHLSGFAPTPLQVTVVYLGGAGLLLGFPRRRVLAVAAAAGALSLVPPGVVRSGGDLDVSILDVGQGDSSLVELPSGESLLVDAGGRLGGADRGETVVLPALRARGIRKLELLLVSHSHPDHAGGLAAVAGGMPVALVACPAGEEGTVRELLGPGGKGIPLRGLARGDRLRLGGGEVEVLWPPASGSAPEDDLNDRSLVVTLRAGRSALLFPGDAGRRVLEGLAAVDGPSLRADLLKVPHHGSAASLSPGFLKAVGPHVAVVTAGRNAFGHPHPGVMKALRDQGTRVLVTGECGTVEGIVRGGDVSFLTWDGRTHRPSPGGALRWFVRGY